MSNKQGENTQVYVNILASAKRQRFEIHVGFGLFRIIFTWLNNLHIA